jgi:hypothetical protein
MYLEICPFLQDFQIYYNIINLLLKVVSDDFLDFHGVCCISPLAFLILLIWVFSILILVRFARGLSILLSFSMNQLFVSFILCIFFVSISLISALILLFLSFYLF